MKSQQTEISFYRVWDFYRQLSNIQKKFVIGAVSLVVGFMYVFSSVYFDSNLKSDNNNSESEAAKKKAEKLIKESNYAEVIQQVSQLAERGNYLLALEILKKIPADNSFKNTITSLKLRYFNKVNRQIENNKRADINNLLEENPKTFLTVTNHQLTRKSGGILVASITFNYESPVNSIGQVKEGNWSWIDDGTVEIDRLFFTILTAGKEVKLEEFCSDCEIEPQENKTIEINLGFQPDDVKIQSVYILEARLKQPFLCHVVNELVDEDSYEYRWRGRGLSDCRKIL